jgi:hypothetical protein
MMLGNVSILYFYRLKMLGNDKTVAQPTWLPWSKRCSAVGRFDGAGRGMLPRPKRLKTSGTLRWSLNLATGYIPRRAFDNPKQIAHTFLSL